jgi:excisionase family DNA binding protein
MSPRKPAQPSIPEDPDPLLTREQAAAALQVSQATFDRIVAAGDIDVVRPGNGRLVRVARSAIRDYQRRRTIKAAANTPRHRGTRPAEGGDS